MEKQEKDSSPSFRFMEETKSSKIHRVMRKQQTKKTFEDTLRHYSITGIEIGPCEFDYLKRESPETTVPCEKITKKVPETSFENINLVGDAQLPSTLDSQSKSRPIPPPPMNTQFDEEKILKSPPQARKKKTVSFGRSELIPEIDDDELSRSIHQMQEVRKRISSSSSEEEVCIQIIKDSDIKDNNRVLLDDESMYHLKRASETSTMGYNYSARIDDNDPSTLKISRVSARLQSKGRVPLNNSNCKISTTSTPTKLVSLPRSVTSISFPGKVVRVPTPFKPRRRDCSSPLPYSKRCDAGCASHNRPPDLSPENYQDKVISNIVKIEETEEEGNQYLRVAKMSREFKREYGCPKIYTPIKDIKQVIRDIPDYEKGIHHGYIRN